MSYAKYFKPEVKKPVPQTKQLVKGQVKNAAGGYAFTASSKTRALRFLMIGTEGGSFYEGEKQMTLANAKNLMAVIQSQPEWLLGEIIRISEAGEASSNSPALFALALIISASDDVVVRRAAYDALPRVARTGTHLFEFAEILKALRGNLTGRQWMRGINNWYNSHDAKSLAYAVTKYQQREGWSHKDLIRLGHVHSANPEVNAVIGYAAGKMHDKELPAGAAREYLNAVEAVKHVGGHDLTGLITDFNLPREVIPTEHLNSRAVWEAMLPKMPYTATLRNLVKMTELGMFDGFSEERGIVIDRLTDAELIRKGRVHPLAILIALHTYGKGVSYRSGKRWTPNQQIVGALNDAFRASFAVTPAIRENIVLALDVSGSMSASVNGYEDMSAAEAAAAVALVYANVQRNLITVAFDNNAREITINPRGTVEDAYSILSSYGGGTSMNSVFDLAQRNRWRADGFLFVTDSESWSGRQHVVAAWESYNRSVNQMSRVFNVQTTASQTQLFYDTTEAIEAAGFSPNTFVMANKFFQHEL